MSLSEILVIMVIVLILFGPEDLPDIARTIGKVVYEIRRTAQELTSEIQSSLIDNPVDVANKAFKQAISPKTSERENHTSVSEAPKDEIDKDLLTYEDEIKADPLADLPADMVTYEKNEEKGASR